jgi:hypothetical protein
MAKKISKTVKKSEDQSKKNSKVKPFGSKGYKKILTRVSEGTGEKNENVFIVEFQIPELNTDWMWLATMPSREKAKRVAKMCRDGLL